MQLETVPVDDIAEEVDAAAQDCRIAASRFRVSFFFFFKYNMMLAVCLQQFRLYILMRYTVFRIPTYSFLL